MTGPSPRVSVVTLNDGSVVRYTWYRFVDQPAIAALGLSESQRAIAGHGGADTRPMEPASNIYSAS